MRLPPVGLWLRALSNFRRETLNSEVAMTFEQALISVLRYEGGYVDHPSDPGGATNQGITQATYDAWRGSQNMPTRPVRGTDRFEVEAIYRTRYWIPARCPDLPPLLRLVHFDAAVNCGVEQAAKFLQRAAGVADDGAIGPATLAAVQGRPASALLHDMLWERLRYYREIAIRKRPDGRDLSVFLAGWIGRLLDVRSATGTG